MSRLYRKHLSHWRSFRNIHFIVNARQCLRGGLRLYGLKIPGRGRLRSFGSIAQVTGVPIVLLTLLSGCSLFSANHTVYFQDGEGRFSESLLNAVTPRKTSRQWLEAHFGPPLYAEAGPGSVEMLTWQFTRKERTDREMFLVLRQRRIVEHHHYLHAVIEQDQVVQSWRNNFAKPDVDRVWRALGYHQQPRPGGSAASTPSGNHPVSRVNPQPATAGLGVQPERVVVEETAADDSHPDSEGPLQEPLLPELTELLKPEVPYRQTRTAPNPSDTPAANDPLYRL